MINQPGVCRGLGDSVSEAEASLHQCICTREDSNAHSCRCTWVGNLPFVKFGNLELFKELEYTGDSAFSFTFPEPDGGVRDARAQSMAMSLSTVGGFVGRDAQLPNNRAVPRSSFLQDASESSVLSKTTFRQFGCAVIKMANAVTAVRARKAIAGVLSVRRSARLCKCCQ